MDGNAGVLRFTHRVTTDDKHYFAFCYPKSYEECQADLRALEMAYGNHAVIPGSEGAAAALPAPSPSLYFARECAAHTLDKRRMDLLTVRTSVIHTYASGTLVFTAGWVEQRWGLSFGGAALVSVGGLQRVARAVFHYVHGSVIQCCTVASGVSGVMWCAPLLCRSRRTKARRMNARQ